jgi:hypothetical protein
LKVTKQTTAGPVISTFEIGAYHRIFVDAENAISPAEPLYTPGDFDRGSSGNDPEDLRWIVDFEHDLNDSQPVVLKHPTFPITEMYVSQSVLYSDKLHFIDDPVNLVNITNNTITGLFGNFSEAGKADINCQEGGAVIVRVEGPLGFNLVLPHVAGFPHTIEFDNTCPGPIVADGGSPADGAAPGNPPAQPNPPAVKSSSDFKLYYDVVQSTRGVVFDLQLVNPASGEGAVCNNTRVGVTDRLFPLP